MSDENEQPSGKATDPADTSSSNQMVDEENYDALALGLLQIKRSLKEDKSRLLLNLCSLENHLRIIDKLEIKLKLNLDIADKDANAQSERDLEVDSLELCKSSVPRSKLQMTGHLEAQQSHMNPPKTSYVKPTTSVYIRSREMGARENRNTHKICLTAMDGHQNLAMQFDDTSNCSELYKKIEENLNYRDSFTAVMFRHKIIRRDSNLLKDIGADGGCIMILKRDVDLKEDLNIYYKEYPIDKSRRPGKIFSNKSRVYKYQS